MKRVGNFKEHSLDRAHRILSNLKEKFPDKAFCIEFESWHFDSEYKKDTFKISIVPGFDEDCTQYTSETWSELLSVYRKIMKGELP